MKPKQKFTTLKKASSTISIIILCLMCSSCFTYKSLTKKNEKITKDILTQIIPDKKYKVKSRNGVTIRIDKIDSVKVYGRIYKNDIHQTGKVTIIPYEATLDDFIENSMKISERKFNLPLTIGVPIVVLGVIILIGWLSFTSMTLIY